MASARFEKGSREWCMFQDYWKLCQMYWIPEDDKGYWDNVVADTDKFYEKYKDVSLTGKITLGLVSDLEERAKKNRKQ